MARRGYTRVIGYIDDFWVGGNTWQECCEAQEALITLLGDLGFTVSWKKTISPSTKVQYLGIEFDSIKMTLALPTKKLVDIHRELRFFVGKKRATKHQIQRLCGVLAHAAKVVYGGRTFSRRIINLLKSLPERNVRVKLTEEFRLDLDWWIGCMDVFNGVSTMISHHFMAGESLYTDSSKNGYGILYDRDWLAGYYNVEILPDGYESLCDDHSHWCNLHFDDSLHINVLELIPIWMSVQRYGAGWQGKLICCYSDNTQVVSCINTGRSINSVSMNMLRDIFWYSAYYNFHLVGRHVKGKLNVLPDLLSRIFATNDLSLTLDNNLFCRRIGAGQGT